MSWKLLVDAKHGSAYFYYRSAQEAIDYTKKYFNAEWLETKDEDGELISAVTSPTEGGKTFTLSPLVFEDE